MPVPYENPFTVGQVTLVGAGPGDPELLTIKALRAIQAATVILVDDLVSPEILALAAPSARVIPVGKRGGCTSTSQSFIEKLMIAAASEGQNVVRLKGGDPFLFGRGGEEVEHLQAAGVRVSVVNGITSGLAALTSLNIALTNRSHAHGVVFVTGHATPGNSAVDWPCLAQAAAQARLTLVIYMGIATSQAIQRGLLQGLSGSTPVAVIQNATLPQQRHVISTLENLCQAIADHRMGSPAVIVVGDVIRGTAALVVGEAQARQVA
jgi:uroporphyrin-III C-methyltransferase